jgi:hypothetical protein
MYPQEVSEVVITELIANSLDAKASEIRIDFDTHHRVLVFQDNGEGMGAKQFEEYHDFAAGLKRRGSGIGFAGLGAKISFNVATRVITETCSRSFKGGSDWYLQSSKKLVWEDREPVYQKERGTRVEIHFKPQANITYQNRQEIIAVIQSQYLPLLDERFMRLYSERMHTYPADLTFFVNGEPVPRISIRKHFKLSQYHEFAPTRRGKGYGFGFLGLAEKEYPLGINNCGLYLCAYGKMVKPEFFNQFPGKFGSRMMGLVEVPELIDFLTTSKTDFTRKGKFRKFEGIMAPIREELKSWLHELGVDTMEVMEKAETLKLERELKKIIDELPELGDFFGQYFRKRLLTPNADGDVQALETEGAEMNFPMGEGQRGQGSRVSFPGEMPGSSMDNENNGNSRADTLERNTRRGPKCRFVNAPDQEKLSWAEGNYININHGHALFKRFDGKKTVTFLLDMISIAMAVQRLKIQDNPEDDPDLEFIDRMMAKWAAKQ